MTWFDVIRQTTPPLKDMQSTRSLVLIGLEKIPSRMIFVSQKLPRFKRIRTWQHDSPDVSAKASHTLNGCKPKAKWFWENVTPCHTNLLRVWSYWCIRKTLRCCTEFKWLNLARQSIDAVHQVGWKFWRASKLKGVFPVQTKILKRLKFAN